MAILQAKNVSKSFLIDGRSITILKKVNFSAKKGEFVVIEGESGSGKSTLISILSGLDKPTKGSIHVENKNITALDEDTLAPLRNADIGFVFQSFHLVPSLTALENIMFPAELNKDPDAQQRALELLKTVGLSKRKNSFPYQLSGGEKQRVALCRALINNPKIIFADEPTGNLDSINGKSVMDLLMKFHKQQKTTLVLVTHSKDIAKMADRRVKIVDGIVS